jgi:hypothetical protein
LTEEIDQGLGHIAKKIVSGRDGRLAHALLVGEVQKIANRAVAVLWWEPRSKKAITWLPLAVFTRKASSQGRGTRDQKTTAMSSLVHRA